MQKTRIKKQRLVTMTLLGICLLSTALMAAAPTAEAARCGVKVDNVPLWLYCEGDTCEAGAGQNGDQQYAYCKAADYPA